MNPEEKKLILTSFAKYYRVAKFDVPSIERREFGVGFDKKIDARHMGFTSEDLLRGYLLSNTPLYISYSTAYYENPQTTPIENKGWLGADLIFDLDIHAEGKFGVYLKLDKVKEDTIRLVEEFLIPDFGIKKQDISYVFSGNRGYHIHVRCNDVFELGSRERREMVDYIRGVGLDYRKFFYEDDRGKIIGPNSNDTGYKKRFLSKVVEVLEKSPSKIYRGFSKEDVKDNFLKGIKDGNWSRSPISYEKLMGKLDFISKELPLLSVDADAAVTYDVKKLIRMPDSIHGSTGFLARKVENMDTFDPLEHALIPFKSTIKVKFLEDVPKIRLKSQDYSAKMGEIKEIPLYAGIFFILKGVAALNP